MRKRILGALLAMCMVLALMPSMAFAASAPKLIVDGVDLVTAPNYQINCSGGGTAAYDPASRTLTLNNAIITNHSSYGPNNAGIYIDGFDEAVTIKLIGENKIHLDNKGIGVFKWGDSALNIVAGGNDSELDSMDIVTYLANDGSASSPYGVRTDGDLNIGRVKLNISLTDNSKSNGFAVASWDNAVTLDGTVLNVSDYNIALYAMTAFKADNIDFTVNSVEEDAILIDYGSAEIKNSKITVQDTTDYTSVWVYGDLTVIDSEVDVHSKYENGIGCDGKLTVSGGKLSAAADDGRYPAVFGGNGILFQNEAEITATSDNGGYPIYAKKTDYSDENSKPADDSELIVLGKDMRMLGGADVVTSDWEYDSAEGSWCRVAYFDTDAANIVISAAYDITYAPGANGAGNESTIIKNKGTDITLEGAIFTRDGYTQIGWATTENATTAEYALGAKYDFDAAVTLYPVWRDNRTKSETTPTDTGLTGSTASEAKSPKTGDTAGRNLVFVFVLSGSVFAAAWICGRKKKD